MRTDIVKMYKDIHGWVGIISGLALFIAFYAGAITMFEEPLQRWASPPTTLSAPVPLERVPELIEKATEAHPKAGRSYEINLEVGPERPAPMRWTTGGRGEEDGARETFHANLSPSGELEVTKEGPSGVAQFVDVLHQQVGLPLDHEIAMPIMGAIALLYVIALVSGTFVLIPSLVKDLFALRIGKNLKRMWLDLHNVLGLFSLPFHIIMALTAVIFAFHDQIYDVQDRAVYGGQLERMFESDETHAPPPPAGAQPLSPAQIVARLEEQAPGFTPRSLQYRRSPDGELSLRVAGKDPRYGLRGPTEGFAGVDPYSGRIVDTNYMPGRQSGWYASLTSFFALHFGNFGGSGVRWAYFLLGLGGAVLFYTGNLLWVETRRKKERKRGAVEQTRGTRFLGALSVGVSLGCIAGISLTIAAAKFLPGRVGDIAAWHSWIYYLVFMAMTAFALVRGAARSSVPLLLASALATACIPLASLLGGWSHGDATRIVDLVALAGVAALLLAARRTAIRVRSAPRDSIWFAGEVAAPPVAAPSAA